MRARSRTATYSFEPHITKMCQARLSDYMQLTKGYAFTGSLRDSLPANDHHGWSTSRATAARLIACCYGRAGELFYIPPALNGDRLLLERVTFLLAIIGYAGLTATAVAAASRRLPWNLWRVVVLTILSHVTLVWGGRYEWQLSEATRNGYAGFLIFHGALTLIVLSLFVREQVARVCVWIAFAVVTLGALGAVFRYEVVAPYRIPVILLAAAGTAALMRTYWLKSARVSEST